MSVTLTPGKGRRRTASAARARPRSSARASGRRRRGLLLPRQLLLPVLVLLTFVAALICDPAAVMRLVWACLSGAFGEPVQIVGSAILVSVVVVMVWSFRSPPTSVPARRKSVRRQAERTTSCRDPSASRIKQQDAADAPKPRPRTRRTPEAADAQGTSQPRPSPANSGTPPPKQSNAAGKTSRSKTLRDSSPIPTSKPDSTKASAKVNVASPGA